MNLDFFESSANFQYGGQLENLLYEPAPVEYYDVHGFKTKFKSFVVLKFFRYLTLSRRYKQSKTSKFPFIIYWI